MKQITSSRLTSPSAIASWDHEALTNSNVVKPETTKPVVEGLFCPKGFGVADGEMFMWNLTYDETVHCLECSVDWLPREIANLRLSHIDLTALVVILSFANLWFRF
ncbi:MAG: hypothetical protein ACTS42_00050 [Candidatus Hodgkinia cicadicola]